MIEFSRVSMYGGKEVEVKTRQDCRYQELGERDSR